MSTTATPAPLCVAALCGSLRDGSLNAAVLATAAGLLDGSATLTVNDGLDRLPFFNPDVEATAPPRVVEDYRAFLAEADAVLIAAPEYAHGMSGVLKNALEWSVGSGDFAGKPTAVVSASPSMTGGDRAQAWTRETLEVMDAVLLPPLLIPCASAKIRDGRVHDESTLRELRTLLSGLAAAARESAMA